MRRRSKARFTKEKRKQFLEVLGETANITDACRDCGVCRSTVYQWRDKDVDFAAAWAAAIERGTDALEDEAVRRALEGRVEPVFYQGAECGRVRKYSDSLLMFLLRARRPEKFKDRPGNEPTGETSLKAVLDAIDGKTRGLPRRR